MTPYPAISKQLSGATWEYYRSYPYFSIHKRRSNQSPNGVNFSVGRFIDLTGGKHACDMGYAFEPWEIGQLLGGN